MPGPNIGEVQWIDRDHWTALILGPGATVYGLELIKTVRFEAFQLLKNWIGWCVGILFPPFSTYRFLFTISNSNNSGSSLLNVQKYYFSPFCACVDNPDTDSAVSVSAIGPA